MATRIGVPLEDQPRIIVDCTHTFHTGARTGIQRVVRHFADALLAIAPPRGIEVLPARAVAGRLVPLPVAEGHVRFPESASAREAVGKPRPGGALRAAGHRINLLRSERWARWLEAGPNEWGLERMIARESPPAAGVIALGARDIVLSLDSSWVYDIRSALDRAGRAGATRIAMLCDVLPVTNPEYFTQGTCIHFRGWLEALLPRLEGLLTISRATGEALEAAVAEGKLRVDRMPPWRAIHLGADVATPDAAAVRPAMARALAPGASPALLTVGTLEPRKNVDYALDLFDALLARGCDVQWHIVGAEGWLAGHTAQRIRTHAEHGARLYWWTDASDVELAWMYREAAALVALSKAEGFGLPLVEARLQGLPVFASDIPVFREVLGNEGRYLPLGNVAIAAAFLADFLRGALPVPPRGEASRAARPWSAHAATLLDAVLAMHGRAPAHEARIIRG